MASLKELQKIYGVIKNLDGDEAEHYVLAFKHSQVLDHLWLPNEFAQATTSDALRILLAQIEREIDMEEGRAYHMAQKQLDETFDNIEWTKQALHNTLCMLLNVPNIDIENGTLLDADGTPVEDEHFHRLPSKRDVRWAGQTHYDREGKEVEDMDYDLLSPENKKQCSTVGYFFINTVSFGSQRIYEDAKPFIEILLEQALRKYPQLATRLACELYEKPNGEQGKLRPYNRIIVDHYQGNERFVYGVADQLRTGLIQNRTHLNIATLEHLVNNPYQIDYSCLEAKDLKQHLIFAQAARNDTIFKSLFLEQELSTYRDRSGMPMKRMVTKNGKYEFVDTDKPTTAEYVNYLKHLALSWRMLMVQRVVQISGVSNDPSSPDVALLQMAAEDYGYTMQRTAPPQPTPDPQSQKDNAKDQGKPAANNTSGKSNGGKPTSTSGGGQ